MKDQERDTFDDLFRSKLHNFEMDTMPGDWDAISSRLPGKAPVPFRRTLRYWAAAAVVSLLMITGSVYLYTPDKERTPVAEAIREKTEAVESQLAEQVAAPVASVAPSITTERSIATERSITKKTAVASSRMRTRMGSVDVSEIVAAANVEQVALPSDTVVAAEEVEVAVAQAELSATPQTLIADAAPTAKEKAKEIKPRRWGFGMGGGSVTAGTSNSLNTYAFKNTMMSDPELTFLNSTSFDKQVAKTNIHHKTPVTVGLGVSYYLNDRFSLQSGLNYTFMSSDWETNGDYHRETKQKLHFIGIPLSLSYKIAEWNRLQFYAAAGGMTEMNVAGNLISETFVKKEAAPLSAERESIRMKEWMWSVNARVGVSYPLLRFISLYAEVGADYYFDNGSKIETVRSEKPFNVNLQAGFRFGF